MENKKPVDLLIEYIKKYSVTTPHSENFSIQVSEIFNIDLQENGVKKLKLQKLNEDIFIHKSNCMTYDLELIKKYNDLVMTI